jgi:hypothetical protein
LDFFFLQFKCFVDLVADLLALADLVADLLALADLVADLVALTDHVADLVALRLKLENKKFPKTKNNW